MASYGMLRSAAWIALALLLAGSSRAQETPSVATQTIIVLDASGSMWGQIEGVAKIDIAKDVIKELLESLDPKLELGLMAYGHRRKADCADIELMIPPGEVNRSRFLEVVQSISPKGKTPLTDSVEAAADYLQYETNPGSVILVSDGIENCDRDPSELAKILKEKGLSFQVHVIAFDLTEKDAKTIRCLADETGGQFLPAQDAGTLKDALHIAVREVIDLAAKAGKKSETGHAAPPAPKPTPQPVPKPAPQPAPKPAPKPAAPQTAPAPPVEVLESATLKGPATVVAGNRFKVEWTGPDNRGDRVGIVVKGAPDEAPGNFRYTFLGSPTELVAPVEPGPCELRYRSRSGKILGRTDIEVVEALATIKAPAEIPAGTQTEIAWTGPGNKGDQIIFAPPGSAATESASSRYAVADRNPTEIYAPVAPGDYEVRYVTARTPKVLALQLVKVVPAQATLKTVDSVMAGAPFPVEWTGPAGQGDTIVITVKGAGNNEPGDSAYPREVTVLEAPVVAGPHEVRYMGRGAKILAAIDINVTPPIATIRGPESAMAGAPIEVNWTGPAGKNDFVIVTEKSAADNLTSGYNYTNKGSPVIVVVPDVVGPGEVRYVSGKTKTVLQRQPLDIVEPVAILSAVPATVKPKSWIEFQWTGPENRRDNFTVAKSDAAGKDALTLRRVAPGEPGKVRAPKEAGEFELRYVSASGKILARQAITIAE